MKKCSLFYLEIKLIHSRFTIENERQFDIDIKTHCTIILEELTLSQYTANLPNQTATLYILKP